MVPSADSTISQRQVSRGAAAMLSGQLGRFALQFFGAIVLARILAPTDYGLIAIVLVMIGLGEVLRDFGLSLAAIQSATLSEKERNNLFWANTAIGLVLTLVALAAAPWFSEVFSDHRIEQIVYVLAWTFVVNGMSAQYRAGLNRSLKYGRLALVDTLGQAIGFAAGLALALAGAGYWALALQQMTQALAALAVAVLFGRWRPGKYDRATSIAKFLQFGWPLVITQLIGFASRNTDSVIIGHQFGPGPLGLYSRAFQLLMLPLNQLNAPSTQVALPILSRLQNQRSEFDRYLVRGQAIMSLIVCVLFVFLGIHADALVAFLFGPKWSASANLFAILAIAGCFQAVSYATYWAFLALGATRSNLVYSLISRSIVIAMVIGGAQWGVEGVAYGYTIALGITWPLGLLWVSRFLHCPGISMLRNGTRSLLAAFLVGAPTAAVEWLLPDQAPCVTLIAAGLALLISTICLALIWPQFRGDLKSFATLARSAIATKGKKAL